MVEIKECHYINGQLKYRHQYLNGKKHGVQIGEVIIKKSFSLYGETSYYYLLNKGVITYYIKGEQVLEKEWSEYYISQNETQFLTDMYV